MVGAGMNASSTRFGRLVEASSTARRAGPPPHPAQSELYLSAQLRYLVDDLAILGVTLLPYSAPMDR
jgi:hypothetical protein